MTRRRSAKRHSADWLAAIDSALRRLLGELRAARDRAAWPGLGMAMDRVALELPVDAGNGDHPPRPASVTSACFSPKGCWNASPIRTPVAASTSNCRRQGGRPYANFWTRTDPAQSPRGPLALRFRTRWTASSSSCKSRK